MPACTMRDQRRARIVAGVGSRRGSAILVRLVGLEPTRSAPAPQAGVSTNSTTAACPKSQIGPRYQPLSLLRRLARLRIALLRQTLRPADPPARTASSAQPARPAPALPAHRHDRSRSWALRAFCRPGTRASGSSQKTMRPMSPSCATGTTPSRAHRTLCRIAPAPKPAPASAPLPRCSSTRATIAAAIST